MGSRRTLILVAAIAIGAVAAFLVWGYVGGIQDKAYGNAEKVKVYVVKNAVPKGTYGEEAKAQKLIVQDEIPKKFFPPNAIRDLDLDTGGKVAVNDLAVNQIVTNDMFADPTTVQSTFADRLEKIRGEDQVAVTISVDTIRGVAGLLQPGDYVNIMATGASKATDDSTSAAAGAEVKNPDYVYLPGMARFMYQKVQILAIDQTPVAQPGDVQSASTESEGDGAAVQEQNRGMLTLIVPAKAAQYIASMEPGSFYLTLVPPDYKPVPQDQLPLSNDPNAQLPGEAADQLTPYGPSGPGK